MVKRYRCRFMVETEIKAPDISSAKSMLAKYISVLLWLISLHRMKHTKTISNHFLGFKTEIICEEVPGEV